jgi:acetylornithine deacetylase/succinyl-diaminopimelate desuccinylase-like protein
MSIDSKFLRELADYVAIPSVSAQPAHAKDCVTAANWVAKKLTSIGFSSKLVPTGNKNTKGHPLVVGTYRTPAPKNSKVPHIVVYGHYDVQPAEPFNLWKTPPFASTVKGTHAYGRGVADNKGPTLALLWGLAEALKKNPHANITCLIEGEEEVGSKNLPATLQKLKKELGHIDAVVLSDTESLSAQQLVITSGVRGLFAIDFTLRGLMRDLHSGNGGPVPNAIRELTRVLGSVFDKDGWVNIPHFYDGVLPAARAELAGIKKTLSPQKFAKEIGAKGFYPLNGKSPFEANKFFPSFELNGILGGYQGDGVKTIIPASATAKITCRIAPGQNPDSILKTVIDGLLTRVDKKLFDAEISIVQECKPAYATPLPHLNKADAKRSSPGFKNVIENIHDSVELVTRNAPLYIREGASIPILPDIKAILGADAVMLGLANEDSGMHSPEENIDLRILETGIKVWQTFFESFAH